MVGDYCITASAVVLVVLAVLELWWLMSYPSLSGYLRCNYASAVMVCVVVLMSGLGSCDMAKVQYQRMRM